MRDLVRDDPFELCRGGNTEQTDRQRKATAAAGAASRRQRTRIAVREHVEPRLDHAGRSPTAARPSNAAPAPRLRPSPGRRACPSRSGRHTRRRPPRARRSSRGRAARPGSRRAASRRGRRRRQATIRIAQTLSTFRSTRRRRPTGSGATRRRCRRRRRLRRGRAAASRARARRSGDEQCKRGDVLQRDQDVAVQLDVRDVLEVAVRGEDAVLILAAEQGDLDLLALVLVGVVLHRPAWNLSDRGRETVVAEVQLDDAAVLDRMERLVARMRAERSHRAAV